MRRGGGKDRRGGERGGEREPGKPRSSSPESQAPPAPAAAVMVIQTSPGKKVPPTDPALPPRKAELLQEGKADSLRVRSAPGRAEEASWPLHAPGPQGSGAGNC